MLQSSDGAPSISLNAFVVTGGGLLGHSMGSLGEMPWPQGIEDLGHCESDTWDLRNLENKNVGNWIWDLGIQQFGIWE